MFDSVWIRVQEPEQLAKLTPEDMLNFVEALTVNGQANRQMSMAVAKILKKTDVVSAKRNPEVALFSASYLADFDLRVSEGLSSKLAEELLVGLPRYSLRDLSYLAIALRSQANFSGNTELMAAVDERIRDLINDNEFDQDTRERLALVGHAQLGDETAKELVDLETGSNMVSVIEALVRGRQVEKNQIVNGKVKANLVVDGKFFIELHENIAMHYQQAGEYKAMGRAKLAQKVIREELKNDSALYLPVSFVEMEYEADESEYLLKVLDPIIKELGS